jgi:hypothetical protein
MTHNDLIEIAKEFSYYTDNPDCKKVDRFEQYKNDLPEPQTPSLYIEWRTGGMSGGSCWGDRARPCGGEQEPPFESLDELLLKIVPKLSFLQYKKIEKLIKTYEYTRSEYYGNYYEYTRKYIVLEDLYNLLKEWEEIK